MKTTQISELENLITMAKSLMQGVMKAILVYIKRNAINLCLANQFALLKIGCVGFGSNRTTETIVKRK
jgi:hypothetical protein